jgi:hypothetical protein
LKFFWGGDGTILKLHTILRVVPWNYFKIAGV